MRQTRIDREIEFGRQLARGDPESIWGWSTPAGILRAHRRTRLVMEKAVLGPGMHALEIGCGAGGMTELFSASGASITAIDLSEDLLERARKRELPEDRVRFVCSTLEDFDNGENFDAVIGSSVLHHLDLDAALSRFMRLLRPQARFAFAEPNMLNPQVMTERKLRNVFPRFFNQVSPDETAFVRGNLARQLRRRGFVEVEIEPFDWLHPATPESLIGLVSKIGRGLEALPIAREFSGSLIISGRRP